MLSDRFVMNEDRRDSVLNMHTTGSEQNNKLGALEYHGRGQW
jgi:hypothetical protein